MEKDLGKEIKELHKRISELEKMLSLMIEPLRNAEHATRSYLRIAGLLLQNGGLTPDMLFPEVEDSISKEIVRALLSRPDQNISQITELVRSARGTASRRIIRKKLQELSNKEIIQRQQKGTRTVYSLTEKVLKRWSRMLGFKG